MIKMSYEPTLKSVRVHQVPSWFHDAKFGIFIHWSLSSVPAFADIDQGDLVELQKKEGLGAQFFKNPYAEWYLNSLRIEGTQTQKYHKETYGENFKYENFVPMFNKAIERWNPKEWANLFKRAGAKYVVLVTKHHDGFLLWPSNYPNPKVENYYANRDIVGELTSAVKTEGMIMGFYYSGALDWTFNEKPITDLISLIDNGPTNEEYIEYVNNHWYELIDKYKPLILWNDIGYPPNTNLSKLFAYFYNKYPEGIVNDRWMQFSKITRRILKFWPIKKLIIWFFNRAVSKEGISMPKPPHFDFQTPEYTVFKEIRKIKWESVRGIGHSFGYNQFEPENQHLTIEELVKMFIDIISKNGNLLLNVGPMADGTIPKVQKELLFRFGEWLEKYGEAVYASRPWIRAEGETLDHLNLRFTEKNNTLYVILMENPNEIELTIKSLRLYPDSEIQYFNQNQRYRLEWRQEELDLTIILPDKIEEQLTHIFKISPNPRNLN